MTPSGGIDLEQYKRQAKDLLKQARSGCPEALARLRSHHPEGDLLVLSSHIQLADTQLTIARENGYASWAKFKEQLLLLNAIRLLDSGDAEGLSTLLKEHPSVVKYRTDVADGYFAHATLLHHIAGNPIRCPLPGNIVQVTTLLLESGADPNSICGVPGNTSSAIGLLLTSKQASEAGVAVQLMDMLLSAGAKDDDISAPDVLSSPLWNHGRKTAEALVRRGVKMDLRHAAALGKIDVLQSLAESTEVTPQVLEEALVYACVQNEEEAVRWLIERGAVGDINVSPGNSSSALHNAAGSGYTEIVQLLLENGASTEILDNQWKATPADWAEYGGHQELATFIRR